jgi:hypothetical protein
MRLKEAAWDVAVVVQDAACPEKQMVFTNESLVNGLFWV